MTKLQLREHFTQNLSTLQNVAQQFRTGRGGKGVDWKRAVKSRPDLATVLKPNGGSLLPLMRFWTDFKLGQIHVGGGTTPRANGEHVNGSPHPFNVPTHLKRFLPFLPQIKGAIEKTTRLGENRIQWRKHLPPEVVGKIVRSRSEATMLGQFAQLLRKNGTVETVKAKRPQKRRTKRPERTADKPIAQLPTPTTPQTLITALESAGCKHCPNCGFGITALIVALTTQKQTPRKVGI